MCNVSTFFYVFCQPFYYFIFDNYMNKVLLTTLHKCSFQTYNMQLFFIINIIVLDCIRNTFILHNFALYINNVQELNVKKL